MTNIAIEHLLAQDAFFAPRGRTDVLFPLPAGSFDYRGPLDRAARFIEEYQLLDTTLWGKFAQVFADRPDGENKGWRGEYWGKMMRGGCITYTYTQSPELLSVLTGAVRALLGTADEDGRISSYPRDAEYHGWDVWSRKYVMLGLEHFLEISPDEELNAEVLRALCAHADYMLGTLGEGEGKIPVKCTSTAWFGVNSSSILEPFVRLFNLTGARKYLDFATEIVESGGACGENVFENAYEDKKQPHEYLVIKAYELISCFEGLVEYYRATGEEKWRTAAVNLGRRIRESEVSIIGCCGCWHELFDHTVTRQLSTEYTGVQQETCVTVTWMKFCLQLLCLTGDSAYADEIEKSAYNALLGVVNFEKNPQHGAMPFDSYSPLVPGTRAKATGGRQLFADGTHYGCCACIGSAGTGLVPLASVLLRRDGVAVNLYLPGTVAAQTPAGERLEMAIKTDYPANGAISIELDTTDKAPFTLALRIPAWSDVTTLAVNGEPVDAAPGTYAEIRRVWKCGDLVELTLDMRAKALRPADTGLPDQNSRYHVALRRGPLILARDLRLGADIETPVSLVCDGEGYAEVEPCDPPDFKVFYAFRAKQTDGSRIPLIDYASTGRSWDNRSLLCAWMPTKRYAAFDPTRPFEIFDSCKSKAERPVEPCISPLSIVDGVICSNAEKPAPFTALFVDYKENGGRIAVGDSYLALDDEGRLVLSKRRGPRFTLVHEGLDHYAIAAPDGRLLAYTKHMTTPGPVTLTENKTVSYTHIFTLRNKEERT